MYILGSIKTLKLNTKMSSLFIKDACVSIILLLL